MQNAKLSKATAKPSALHDGTAPLFAKNAPPRKKDANFLQIAQKPRIKIHYKPQKTVFYSKNIFWSAVFFCFSVIDIIRGRKMQKVHTCAIDKCKRRSAWRRRRRFIQRKWKNIHLKVPQKFLQKALFWAFWGGLFARNGKKRTVCSQDTQILSLLFMHYI